MSPQSFFSFKSILGEKLKRQIQHFPFLVVFHLLLSCMLILRRKTIQFQVFVSFKLRNRVPAI